MSHAVGYHGSDFVTPVLDKLATTYAQLDRYYVQARLLSENARDAQITSIILFSPARLLPNALGPHEWAVSAQNGHSALHNDCTRL